MTYVVGIRSGDTSAILCDSRVSFDNNHANDHNYALKSGSLFPGCIYAGVGNASALRSFVKRTKTYLTGRKTLPEFWDQFVKYFRTHCHDHSDTGEEFQLLLSSRHSGNPQLYIADSTTALVTQQDTDLATLGSGKAMLDSIVEQLHKERHNAILADISRQSAPEWFFGYWYCLALTECAQGDMASALADSGVGGTFHYSYQTCTEEHRQHPAVYSIVSAFPTMGQITHTLYRVTFEETALVVENAAENRFAISIDDAVWPRVLLLSPAEKEDLVKRLEEGAIAQPFYNFFGVGFADAQWRGQWLTHLNLGDNQYALTRENIESPVINHFVESIITQRDLRVGS